jgi:hypothetical protein
MRKETKRPVVQALLMKKGGSNPLKVFNDNKAAAYKKAGGAMKAFNKYLKKAQDGNSFKNTYAGPLTESDIKRLDQEFPSTSKSGIEIPYTTPKPRMGYGSRDMYVQKEKQDRAAFENYLRSPAVAANNKTLGTGFNSQPLYNQNYNRDAQINIMNKMNNIDWNSEEGKRTKNLLDRDYREAYKKGGSKKTKKPATKKKTK